MSLLKSKASIDTVLADGSCAFHVAAQNNNVQALTYLYSVKPEWVDCLTKTGATPAYVACETGSCDAVMFLLENGANLNHAINTGETLLMISLWNNHLHLAEKLLENKTVDVNIKTKKGLTALHIATQENREKVLVSLLAKKANLLEPRPDSLIPLLVAADKGNKVIFNLLLKAMSPTIGLAASINWLSDGKVQLSPLIAASNHHNLEFVQELLEQKADPNVCSPHGGPLFFAAWRGHSKVMQLLIQAGAKVNGVNNQNQTALSVASGAGKEEAVRLLLKEKATECLSILDSQGMTPLQLAKQYHQDTIIKILEEAAQPD